MQTPIDWLPDTEARPPQQLILLLHGWGADGRSLAPLAQALRSTFPQAAIVCPDAPLKVAADATERQWYAVDGLTPENWPERVDDALPALRHWVVAQQQRLGVGPAATALGGVSQGAVLALALALAPANDGLVGRALSFGGALCAPPLAAPRQTTLHLFHGADDSVIPPEGSRQALRLLAELQGDATLDVANGVGHGLHAALIDCALQRLQTHIPLRTWQAALGAVPAMPASDGAAN